LSHETWPVGVLPTKASFSILRAVPMSAAPFAATPRVTRRPGEIWTGRAEFGLLNDRGWGQITALLDRLGDRAGAVDVPAWDRIRPSRWSPAAPPAPATVTLASHALRGETTLHLAGLSPGAAQLGPGDRLSAAGRLYRIASAAPLVADAAGTCTAQIAPGLREDILIGDEVRLMAPVCRMKLSSALPVEIPVIKAQRGTLTLEFIEADVPSTDNGTARLVFLLGRLTNVTMPASIGVNP
jgi:hypothetical protein